MRLLPEVRPEVRPRPREGGALTWATAAGSEAGPRGSEQSRLLRAEGGVGEKERVARHHTCVCPRGRGGYSSVVFCSLGVVYLLAVGSVFRLMDGHGGVVIDRRQTSVVLSCAPPPLPPEEEV